MIRCFFAFLHFFLVVNTCLEGLWGTFCLEWFFCSMLGFMLLNEYSILPRFKRVALRVSSNILGTRIDVGTFLWYINPPIPLYVRDQYNYRRIYINKLRNHFVW